MFTLLVFISVLATLFAGYLIVTTGAKSNPDVVRYIRDRAAKAEADAVDAARERVGIN